MVLVFILAGIIILNILLFFLILFSNIRLKIENFEMSNIPKVQEKLKGIEENDEKEKRINKENKQAGENKYKVEVALYFLGKIKWIATNLNNERMEKVYNKIQLEKIDLKKIRKDFELENFKEIKKVKPKIILLDLKVNLGTEDVIITSFLVFLISTIIGIILPYTIKKYEKDKYNYEIKPVYANKNVYEIKFDGIFELKMVHIINIIYIFLKRRRVDKNGKSSNRRSYGYSYE